MFYIILIAIVILIIYWIVEHIAAIAKVLGCILGAAGLLWMLINHFFLTLNILGVLAVLFGLFSIYVYCGNKSAQRTAARLLNQYINQTPPFFTKELLVETLEPNIILLKGNDGRGSRSFWKDDIPLGRANAFLSYFETSIYEEEPLYFAPVRSSTDEELREYGLCVTERGVYCSASWHKSGIKIPYKGIYKCEIIAPKDYTAYLSVIYTDGCEIQLATHESCVPLSCLQKFLSVIINKKIGIAYLKKTVVADYDLDAVVQKAEAQLNQAIKENNLGQGAKDAGFAATINARKAEIAQIRNYMNGRQGHGYAAEYANHTIEKLLGKNPVNAAADLVNGHQKKDGADRIVGGQPIQTKYCENAYKTIEAAFKGNYVENGTMMQIEVPRDQYHKALEIMQKKIDNGEVPGAKPGDSAKKYVRRGYVTYAQAHNIAKSGTIESLTIDTLDGAIMSVNGASASALIVFASAIWNGNSCKDAAQQSIKAFGVIMGKGVLSWVIVSQFTRTQGTFAFVGKALNNAADKIASSKLANTKLGDKMGLKNTTSKTLLSNTVTAAMVFGPDICHALSGKISPAQLFKNAVVSTVSLGAGMVAGAKAGAAIGSFVPVLGNIAGAIVGGLVGAAAGSLAKDVMDSFIEDDAKEMFRILKEEFIDLAMLAELTKEEFSDLCELTLLNEDLPKILREMFASEDRRAFARYDFVSPAITQVLAQRSWISSEIYHSSMLQAIEAEAQAEA